MQTHLPSCEDMNILLDQRVEHPEKAALIDRQIHEKFEQEKTIFVLDMSGFSRAVQRYGIIHYLTMIRRMRRIVQPIVEKHDGLVVKFEADNCFAVFDHPKQAIEASRAIHHDLSVVNLMTDEDSDIHVSIGIGHGSTLLMCDDMYGNEMNLASKLGEDVAERNEILLTASAHALVKDMHDLIEFPLSISGVEMRAYRLK